MLLNSQNNITNNTDKGLCIHTKICNAIIYTKSNTSKDSNLQIT